MAPDADHPTRTLARTLTRTLWGDLRLDVVACEFAAVACEGSIIGDIFSLCFRGVCMAYISTRAGAAENVFFSVWIEVNSVFVSGHRNRLDITMWIEINLILVMGSKLTWFLCAVSKLTWF